MDEYLHCFYISSFVNSFFGRHLDCSEPLIIANVATKNRHAYVLVSIAVFKTYLEYVSKSGITESYSNYILMFWGKCQTVLHIVSALPSPPLIPANTCCFSLDALMMWNDSSPLFSILLPWWLTGWEFVHMLICHLYIFFERISIIIYWILKGEIRFLLSSHTGLFYFLKEAYFSFLLLSH